MQALITAFFSLTGLSRRYPPLLRLASRARAGRWVAAVILLAACWCLFPGTASAQTYHAAWVATQEVGNIRYFSDPQSACKWEWEYFAPNGTLGEAYPYNGEWNNYQCKWQFYDGASWASTTALTCVDENNNPAPDGVYPVPSGGAGGAVCVEDPPVSRDSDSGGSDNPITITIPVTPVLPPPGGVGFCTYNHGANVDLSVGDPTILSTGSLYHHVTDYRDADGRLTIGRTYRSMTGSAGGPNPTIPSWFGLGALWRLSFQWDIALGSNFLYGGNFGISTPGGGNYQFALNTDGSVTPYNNGINDISVQFVNPGGGAINYLNIGTNGGQFLITTSAGDQILIGLFAPWYSIYYIVGRPLQITYRGGYVWTFNYGSLGEVDSISDNLGRTISLTWYYEATLGTSTLYPVSIQTITMPDGTILNYGYESYSGTQGGLGSYSRLKTFTRTSGGGTVANSETYLYTASNSPTLLTGVSDNAGVQFNTWQYDSYGHVAYASHPYGADAVNIAYSVDPSGYYRYRTVTNALGLQTAYTFVTLSGYDPLLTGVVGTPTSNCLGTTTTLGYDSNARIASRTDSLGNVTQYTYGADGRVQTKTEASGTSVQRTTSYTWNDTFGVPTQIVKPGLTVNLTYDATGRVTQRQEVDTTTQSSPYSTNGQTRAWTYAYNSSGLLSSVNGPLAGNQTQYGYSTNGYRSSTTNALNQTTHVTSMNAAGQPLTVTDANGVVTTVTYDSDLRLASRQTAGETTSFSYGPTGLLQRITLPDSSYLTYTYDSARRLTQISDSLGNSIVYTLDAMGNRTAENSYDSSSALHRTHTRVFTALSQLYQDVNAAGTSAVTTSFGYDADGNQATISAPLSRTTTDGYDALNRLDLITDPANGNTRFQYDASDRLTSVVDPRNLATTYVYAGLGNQIAQMSPDTGETVKTYDAAGNELTSMDARGAVATYTYDLLNRVTSVAFANAGVTDQTISFTYDAGTNGKGRLTSASDANHSMSWNYDGLGRVTGKGMIVGAVNLSVGYGYTGGDRGALVTPSGQAVVYGYNGNHQVTSVAVNGTTVLTGVTYEPFGGVNGWTWGDGSATTRTFNGDGLVSQIVTAGVTLGYSYDNANRISGITDSSNSALSWTYGYDLLDRLTSATTSTITDGWTYDADGNQLTQTGTTPITFSVNSANNQLSATTGSLVRTYSYDAAGNAQSYSTYAFLYNNRGRMMATSANSTDYLYNALGQMIEKSGTLGTTLFMQDESGHLIGEYDGSGNLIEETIWLGDIPVAALQPNGSGGINIFYVHTDHLNSPRKIAQPGSGQLVWRWDADPFGTAAPNQNPSGLGTFAYNIRFAGQYYQAETGLNQNWQRDYDPLTGKYVESDPIGLRGGINTYVYVRDNPLQWVDPTGLTASCTCFVTCTTLPVTTMVYCIERKTCTENCGRTTTTITSDWYYWPDRPFDFFHGYRCNQFPGTLPTSPGPISFPGPTPGNPPPLTAAFMK